MAIRMGKKIDKDALQQRWIHSHEEDTDTEKVFRPASYKFPPSRGRVSFEIKPNGVLMEGTIGPTDRLEETEGTWKLENDDILFFLPKVSSKPTRVIRIVSLRKNRLTVKK